MPRRVRVGRYCELKSHSQNACDPVLRQYTSLMSVKPLDHPSRIGVDPTCFDLSGTSPLKKLKTESRSNDSCAPVRDLNV